MKKDCEARLRALIPNDEAVVAVGTAEELRELGPEIGSARLNSETHYEIRFDEVKQWASGTQSHRLTIVLTHLPMSRRLWVPAHKILWYQWGNAVADFSLTQTIFRFSRPATQVAKAIHSALAERGVPYQPLHFKERSREERTRGSRSRLYASED